MADNTKTLVLVLKAKDLASAKVKQLGGAFDTASKKTSRFGGALKSLAKIGVFAVITAFVTAIGVIGKATEMAAEEEKGIKRLDAALKANVKGWKGNTDAIEAVIAEREKLAFSDDELRQSLGTLVTATRNVEQAQKLQATAMDVARLKSISLDDASKLLIKAQMGNTRALKELGIELPKNASKTQILAAIQKRAAGQAEAYGKTSAAAHQRFNNALDNLMEDLGKGFLPLMTNVANFATEHVIPAIRDIAGRIDSWFKKNQPLIDQVKKVLGPVLRELVRALGQVFDAFFKVLGVIGDVVGAIGRMAVEIRKVLQPLEDLVNLMQFLPGGAGALEFGASIPRRAAGGPIDGPAIVGENGPELIVGRGQVIPNHKLGGGNQTIVLNIDGREVGRVIVPAVSRQMFYELQRAAPTLART